MYLGKKVADFGYRTFTVGMLALTVYGSILISQRVGTFIRTKEAANTVVNKDNKVELPANTEEDKQ